MEERVLKEWEKGIAVLFDRFPDFKGVIKSPVYYSNAPWARDVSNHFLQGKKGSSGEEFYRVVFKKGSAQTLMTIGAGELSGLKTTSIVEKGRITATAGLEQVEAPAAPNLLAMLLTMGMFGAIQNRLQYIANVCVDIRNHQIFGDHAKLEKISEVILDCFESIPEMDQHMMRLNLARMVANTDECLEVLIVMREELRRESEAKQIPHFTTDWSHLETFGANGCRSTYRPSDFLFSLMNHHVFAAYERFVAGKICQIVLSGNYSPSNIARGKLSVIRVCESIREILAKRVEAHKRGVEFFRQRIVMLEQAFRKGHEISDLASGETVDSLEFSIEEQSKTILKFEQRLHELLDTKIESFDFLVQLADQDEINVYLINGAIVVSKSEATAELEHRAASPDKIDVGVK